MRQSQNNQQMDKLKQMRQQQKEAYDRKRTNFFGQANAGGIGGAAAGDAGQLTLEQMDLDRKDVDGEEFDPFNIGMSSKKPQAAVNVQLQAQNAQITKSTTVGGQFWSPEIQKKQDESRKQPTNDVDELDELDDLADEADQGLPPGQTPIEFQRVEAERKQKQAELDEQHRQR